MVVTQARYGDRNFLIQLYFAWMIVCMTLVKNVVLVLQISKQAKARVNFKRKTSRIKKWNSVPQWDSNPQYLGCSSTLFS